MSQNAGLTKAVDARTGAGFGGEGGFAELLGAELLLDSAAHLLAFGGPRDWRPPVAMLSQIAESMMEPVKRFHFRFSPVLS